MKRQHKNQGDNNDNDNQHHQQGKQRKLSVKLTTPKARKVDEQSHVANIIGDFGYYQFLVLLFKALIG